MFGCLYLLLEPIHCIPDALESDLEIARGLWWLLDILLCLMHQI